MSPFREALVFNDLIQFRTRSGEVLTRLTSSVVNPPFNATAWRVWDDEPWCSDFGGRYLVRGDGRLVWQELERATTKAS